MVKKVLALVLALSMTCAALSACTPTDPDPEDTTEVTQAPDPAVSVTGDAAESTPTQPPAPQYGNVLTVAYDAVSADCNPFFSGEGTERVLLELTQLPLVTLDRSGAVVYRAAAGETVPYRGTDYVYNGLADIEVETVSADTETEWVEESESVYRFTLRDGVTFSDGTPLTADDLIFTLYVLLDPSYNGPVDLTSAGIVGVQEYRTRTPADLYETYSAYFDDGYAQLLEAAAEEDEEGEGDEEGEDENSADAGYNPVSEAIAAAWMAELQELEAYCLDTYLEGYAAFTGYTAQEISSNEGLKVMFTMWLWGFGSMTDEGAFRGEGTGKTWDLESSFPTLTECYEECYALYDGDADAYWRVEGVGAVDILTGARNLYVSEQAALDEAYEPVNSISGIRKVDDRTVEITTANYGALDIYTLSRLYVAPLHHYGDVSLYDPEAGTFGFPYGDLSGVRAARPLGAGPYVFGTAEGVTVELEANPNYYLGVPATPTIRLVGAGTRTAGEILTEGIADVAFTDDAALAEEVAAAYRSAELENVSERSVLSDSFLYIGIRADKVSVGDDPDSEASLALRRAIAAVLAAGRSGAMNGWYGSSGAVLLDVPLSSASWAYPQGADAAYARDADGELLYDSDASAEARMTAAVEAARSWLLAAGYVWSDEESRFVDAPEGGSMNFRVTYVGGGTGDNPCAAMLEQAAVAMYELGIVLSLDDVTYRNSLREKLVSGEAEIWVSDLSCDSYRELYRYFHSDDAAGQNYFGLSDEEVDDLILQIGEVSDPESARDLYREALEEILDHAVIVPCFQPYTYVLFDAGVDGESFPQDLTPYYDWTREAATLRAARLG